MAKYLLTCWLIFPLLGMAQSDCSEAISLDGRLEHKISGVTGHGKLMEFSGNEKEDSHYFTEEYNTTWYTFTAPYDANLTFHVIPAEIKDNIDFLLFPAEEPNSCALIVSKQLQPVRSNLADNDPDKKGVTGLTGTTTKAHVGIGPNSTYSSAIKVKKGSRFLLVIDHKRAGAGHKINLNFDPATLSAPGTDTSGKTSPIRELAKWVNQKPETPVTKYHFNFFDNDSKKPLACDIKVVFENSASGEDSIVFYNGRANLSVEVEGSSNFSLNASKNGYMFYSENYRSFRQDSSVTDTFYLPRAKAGEMISLVDINFQENTTHLLTNSIHALEQIHNFMVTNPNAVIEIRGHVNAPGYENKARVRSFSEKRAEEVRNFLVDMGIEKKRIKTTGLGNEFMIYPSPASYQQEKANRRVEIMILEN